MEAMIITVRPPTQFIRLQVQIGVIVKHDVLKSRPPEFSVT